MCAAAIKRKVPKFAPTIFELSANFLRSFARNTTKMAPDDRKQTLSFLFLFNLSLLLLLLLLVLSRQPENRFCARKVKVKEEKRRERNNLLRQKQRVRVDQRTAAANERMNERIEADEHFNQLRVCAACWQQQQQKRDKASAKRNAHTQSALI